MSIAPGIFRQYDVRGVVGEDLTAETAAAIGRGFAAFLDRRGVARPVVVGRDNRPSGKALRDALVGGLTSCGVDVVDVGVVPTPLVYWSLSNIAVGAGIQITGSHNPAEYNGFQICVGTDSGHGDEHQELRAHAVGVSGQWLRHIVSCGAVRDMNSTGRAPRSLPTRPTIPHGELHAEAWFARRRCLCNRRRHARLRR